MQILLTRYTLTNSLRKKSDMQSLTEEQAAVEGSWDGVFFLNALCFSAGREAIHSTYTVLVSLHLFGWLRFSDYITNLPDHGKVHFTILRAVLGLLTAEGKEWVTGMYAAEESVQGWSVYFSGSLTKHALPPHCESYEARTALLSAFAHIPFAAADSEHLLGLWAGEVKM